MAIVHLNPYLNFDGDAAAAIALYERALGAVVEGVMRFGEGQGPQVAPEHRNRIMHARLRIGGHELMVSDTMPGLPHAAGSNAHVVLHFDDARDMAARFEALAAGGKVTMPLQDTFWGATFGMLTDAHGVQWMMNFEKKR